MKALVKKIRIEKTTAVRTALFFFLIAAILGTLMRYLYLWEIPILDYKHILHAHSHVAMLGWGFISLSTMLTLFFIKHLFHKNAYQNVFKSNVLCCICMLAAFMYQGYGPISIAFCTIHVFIAYYFSWHFLKDLKKQTSTNSTRFAKWSIYLMLISTMGLWMLAPVGIVLGKMHVLYYSSIQFFLHFQFNGWFTFGILALVFKLIESRNTVIPLPKRTLLLLLTSLVLTYTLSITWSTPKDILFYLNSLGVILQLVAFAFILYGLNKIDFGKYKFYKITNWLIKIGVLSLALKVLIQCAVAIPKIAAVSYTIRNFVIGFIHLTMLGSFSLVMIAIFLQQRLLPRDKIADFGYILLTIGFILTEIIIFLQGILLWTGSGFFINYHYIIFGTTAIIPVTLLLLIIQSRRNKKYCITT